MVGFSKARGKGVRTVRRKADESCLHVRADWKSRGLNRRLLRFCKKIGAELKFDTVPGKATALLKDRKGGGRRSPMKGFEH